MNEYRTPADAIAVIGMAGYLPGAENLDEFWRNLCAGRESISRLPAADLEAAGVPAALRDNERYVAARGILGHADRFDADYFGFSPREAELTDPQQRLFLECAEAAVQDAGYDARRMPGPVGVFAGATASSYLHVLRHYAVELPADDVGVRIGNDVDFLATRVAYKLNLTGPAVTVQTACSTGLVAVHNACHSLREGECAAAVVGAASILYPETVGYLYEPGSICAEDGHCRAFDAAATGTVSGNGCLAVVLKPLAAAVLDGDPVRAVILGSAINNDGSAKIGFTAPSVRGQRAVIRLACAAADVDPAGVTYVEAHGTGTALGDPIEVEALRQALGSPAEGSTRWLGSVKPNIGHLDAAAGLAGLVKAVLAVETGLIPPTANFTEPNPQADFGGDLRVADRLMPWPDTGGPRRAGVSSFGVGGTNAHAVIQQAPPVDPPGADDSWQLLPLSAADDGSLDRSRRNLADRLGDGPQPALADVAYTLQTGRRQLDRRLAVVARNPAEAAAALAHRPNATSVAGRAGSTAPRVAFTYPGQGTERRGMARELAAGQPTFARLLRETLDTLALPGRGVIADFLLGADGDAAPVDTAIAQPALFAMQYALARLWRSWGVHPAGQLGHSLGEITAATVAGVFTPSDAARIVLERGRLLQEAPPGAMLTVFASVERVAPLLPAAVSVAAVNGPHSTVVAGPVEHVEALREPLAGRGLRSRRLRTARAFHSAATDRAAAGLRRVVGACRLSAPAIPFVSNLTGDWITAEQATDPGYWAEQMRRPVRFADGVARLVEAGTEVILEVGGGRTLTALCRDAVPAGRATPVLVAGVPVGTGELPAPAAVLRAAGELWTAGAPLDWTGVQDGRKRRRVRLPAYSFTRNRYSVYPDRVPTGPAPAAEPSPYLPSHARPPLPVPYRAPDSGLTRRLGDVFEAVVGVHGVGVDDSFFALGGDSLMAVRVLARVHELYGVDVDGESFFEQPTVTGLSALLTTALEESVNAMDAAQVAALLEDLDGRVA